MKTNKQTNKQTNKANREIQKFDQPLCLFEGTVDKPDFM
ncbi:hypothetical protein FVB9288_02876 [Flavobacterium sp. CECT 9288]|nr:hypothetical protein FVB9288_02876 [Flavobacterium sp. CECT 9288]